MESNKYPPPQAAMQNRIVPVSTSLEERLDHMRRACERISNVRQRLDILADRIASVPGDANVPYPPQPEPQDLTGRFGQANNYLHNNLDAIESLVDRLYRSMFDEKTAGLVGGQAASPGRG